LWAKELSRDLAMLGDAVRCECGTATAFTTLGGRGFGEVGYVIFRRVVGG